MMQELPGDVHKQVLILGEGRAAAEFRRMGYDPIVVPQPRALGRLNGDYRKSKIARLGLAAAWCVPWYWARMRKHLKRAQPDIVHCNDLKAAVLVGIPSKLCRERLVWHLRGEVPGRASRFLVILTGKLADVTVCVSRALYERYPSIGKRALVYNGVPRHRDYAVPEEPERLRGEPDGGDGDPVFVTASSIVAHKGLHLVAEAFAQVLEAYPGSRWIIMGEATTGGQKRYQEGLQCLISEKGISGQVEWLGWVRDPLPWFRVASAVVNVPCARVSFVAPDGSVFTGQASEGLPRVAIEALQAGVPVVASELAGTSEAVMDGVNGYLVEEGDVDQLADRMFRLCEQSNRARMSAAASSSGMEFDAAVTGRRTEAIYRELVE